MTARPYRELEPDWEEQHKFRQQWFAALENGDREEADRLRRKIKMGAEGLMATKKLFGADFIREKGYNTENADKKYGPGWLDKDNGPPILRSFRKSRGEQNDTQ